MLKTSVFMKKSISNVSKTVHVLTAPATRNYCLQNIYLATSLSFFFLKRIHLKDRYQKVINSKSESPGF